MKQTAYIVTGDPGSGKTTYGKNLSKEKNAFLIDIDSVMDRLVSVGLGLVGRSVDDRDSNYYKENYREPVYETMYDIALDNLPHSDVVLVGPFTKEIKNINWPEILKERLRAEIEIYNVYCSPELRKERIVKRGNKRDLPKLENWDKYVSEYATGVRPVFEHVYVDSGKL